MTKQESETSPASEKELRPQKKEDDNFLFTVTKNGWHINHTMNFLRFLFYGVHAILYPFKLHGYKKVGKGAYIFVGNHYCLWDVFYPAHTTREGIHYLAKDSIFHAPVLGYFAKKVRAIGAMRDGSDVRTLMEAMKALRHGDKISMFPEGTRNKVSEEEFLPFHGGAALIAIKTKTPVIPFVICSRPRIFRRTHVVFGEPVELSEYYGRKLTSADYQEADEKLKQRLYDMREQFRSSRGKKRARAEGKR